MGKGRRYEENKKLNVKKVFAVIVTIAVFIMMLFMIKGIFEKGTEKPLIGGVGYYTVFKDDKYGVIDSEGKMIISPSYEEMIVVPNNKVDVFLCTYNVDYKTGEYQTKALNKKNQTILAEYDQIQAIQNKDENDNLSYDTNALKVQKDGKWGLINYSGKNLLKAEYDEIVAVDKSEVVVKINGKYGIVDYSGKQVAEAKYDRPEDIRAENPVEKNKGKYSVEDIVQGENLPGFAIKSLKYNEKANIYIAEDENFNAVIMDSNLEAKLQGMLIDIDTEIGYIELIVEGETKYYNFKFEEKKDTELFPERTLFIRKENGKYGFVDKNGNVVVEYIYDQVTPQNVHGFAGVKKDGLWGSVDMTGKVVQPPTYNLDDYLLIDFIGVYHLGRDANMMCYEN